MIATRGALLQTENQQFKEALQTTLLATIPEEALPLNPGHKYALWHMLCNRDLLISALYPSKILNGADTVATLRTPFRNVQEAKEFVEATFPVGIGQTKEHWNTVLQRDAKPNPNHQVEVLKLPVQEMAAIKSFIVRFLATPLNSFTTYPVLMYAHIFTEILHSVKMDIQKWDDFLEDNEKLSVAMDWENTRKTFINDFIAFALCCSIKGPHVLVTNLQNNLLQMSTWRCPVWEFFVTPMLYVAYTVFPQYFDYKYILRRQLYNVYKGWRKRVTQHGVVSIKFLQHELNPGALPRSVRHAKAMPADFFQAMKFYYRNFDFNPYDKAKTKKGKSAHWYYNVLPDEGKYTKYPVYQLMSSIRLYGPTDEDIAFS
jgi:hypothetical protein